MNELINFHDVEKRVIQLRGKDVLLDYAVAELYGVETKRVNEAVKNNPEKFPQGYVFEISKAEMAGFAVENFDRKNENKARRRRQKRVG